MSLSDPPPAAPGGQQGEMGFQSPLAEAASQLLNSAQRKDALTSPPGSGKLTFTQETAAQEKARIGKEDKAFNFGLVVVACALLTCLYVAFLDPKSSDADKRWASAFAGGATSTFVSYLIKTIF